MSPPPEDSVTELVAFALSKARELAARADAEHQAAAADRDPNAQTSAVQREAEILNAALTALTNKTSETGSGPRALQLVEDAAGFDLRPDPLAAHTPAELMASLRSYRAWCGQPSLRKIAAQAGSLVSHATIRAVLSSDKMPGLAKVMAIVTGCGGSRDDQQNFATAWRRIAMASDGPVTTNRSTARPAGEGVPTSTGDREVGGVDARPINDGAYVEAGLVAAPAGSADQRAVLPEDSTPLWTSRRSTEAKEPGSSHSMPGVQAPWLAATLAGASPATAPLPVGATSFSLAQLLREYRINAGMTQEDLAARSYLSPRTISDLERGVNVKARKDTVRLLAGGLRLSGQQRAVFEEAARGRDLAGELATAIRTLPRDTLSFTGRQTELRDLDIAVRGADRAVVIYAIGGMAGVGKTALAVHAAHRLAPRFPDGQIFLPLHAHTPGQHPVDPANALASLLLMTGVDAQQIPVGLESRASLWRDRLAGKKLLLVLDDAIGSDQVRPLLPGTSGILVLVTSRMRLTALGALAANLDVMAPAEAADLLAKLAARPDLDVNDPAVAEICRLCGYLPLALGLLASRMRHRDLWTAADFAADLSVAHDRFGPLTAENLSVAAAFDLSYQDLSVDQQRMFRRLGLHLEAEIDVQTAAELNDSSLDMARSQLEGLVDHYLLVKGPGDRYRFHDLIREYARLLVASDPGE